MKQFTVRDFLKQKGRIYHLSLLTDDEKGLDRVIYNPDLNRPGLIFTGFVHKFGYDRIQVLGQTEIAYLRSLTSDEQKTALDLFLDHDLPCILVDGEEIVLREGNVVGRQHVHQERILRHHPGAILLCGRVMVVPSPDARTRPARRRGCSPADSRGRGAG